MLGSFTQELVNVLMDSIVTWYRSQIRGFCCLVNLSNPNKI